MDVQSACHLVPVCEGTLDSNSKGSAVRPGAHAEHISPQIDNRALHPLFQEVVLHLVRNKSLGNRTQINRGIIIRKGNHISLQGYLLIADTLPGLPDCCLGRHMRILSCKIPKGAQGLYRNIKGPLRYVAVLQSLLDYLRCLLRHLKGALPRCPMIQLIYLTGLLRPAEEILIFLAERKAAVQYILIL